MRKSFGWGSISLCRFASRFMLIVRDGRKRVVVGGGGDESCHPSPPLFLQAAVVVGTAVVAVAVTARQWRWQWLRWLQLCGGGSGSGGCGGGGGGGYTTRMIMMCVSWMLEISRLNGGSLAAWPVATSNISDINIL
jgi:hypothetical protein